MHGLTLRIGQDLHFDVPGAHHSLLEEHGRVAECAVRLAHRGLERIPKLLGLVDAAHATPATARDGLGEDREADVGSARK